MRRREEALEVAGVSWGASRPPSVVARGGLPAPRLLPGAGPDAGCRERGMRPLLLLWALVRVAVSTLCAGFFYAVWLGAFLSLRPSLGDSLMVVFWPAAPFVTAAGYAFGLGLIRPGERPRRDSFLPSFIWALLGCGAGAAVVFPFGPMLIVFGMFVLGSLTVAGRELLLARGRQDHEGAA